MRPFIASIAIFIACLGCMQSAPPAVEVWKPIDAGLDMWIHHGPIEMAVESLRHGNVTLRNPTGSTECPAFVVGIRVRYCGDRHVDSVSLLPFQPLGPTPGRGEVVLEDETGRRYPPLKGFESFVGHRTAEAHIDRDHPDALDELVFDPAAGDAATLVITLPSLCRARDAEGRDVMQPLDRPPFRFRLLRWMWVKPA